MAGFLTDLESAAKGAVSSVNETVSHFGHDAQLAIDQATRNTAQLAGSGFNGHEVTGALGEMFGRDPHAFILSIVGKAKSRFRKLCIRVAERTGRLDYSFPTKSGQRRVTAKPPSSASTAQIALTVALAAIDAPATMAEEAGRAAAGLDVKERGLAGFTIIPMSLPHDFIASGGGAHERGLVEGIPAPTPTDAVVAIAIPILIAIAIKVLPALIEGASNFIKDATAPKGPTPAEQAAAAAAQKDEEQKSTMVTVGVVGGVILLGLVGLYFATRKKAAA